MMANSVHVHSGALTTSTSPNYIHHPESANLRKSKAEHPAGPGLASPRDADLCRNLFIQVDALIISFRKDGTLYTFTRPRASLLYFAVPSLSCCHELHRSQHSLC